VAAAVAVADARRSGTMPSTGEQSSGLVPQVTIGAKRAASNDSSRSNAASASVGSVFQ